jgi:hypothetical protein
VIICSGCMPKNCFQARNINRMLEFLKKNSFCHPKKCETHKKLKKKEKKKNRNANMDEIDKQALNLAYDLLPSPSFKITLLIRLVLWLYSNKISIPAIHALLKARLERKADVKHTDDENGDAELDKLELAKRLERKCLVNKLNHAWFTNV